MDALTELHRLQLKATGLLASALSAIGPHVASVLNDEERARVSDAIDDLNSVGAAMSEVVGDVPGLLAAAADAAVKVALEKLLPEHVAAVVSNATAQMPEPAAPPPATIAPATAEETRDVSQAESQL